MARKPIIAPEGKRYSNGTNFPKMLFLEDGITLEQAGFSLVDEAEAEEYERKQMEIAKNELLSR